MKFKNRLLILEFRKNMYEKKLKFFKQLKSLFNKEIKIKDLIDKIYNKIHERRIEKLSDPTNYDYLKLLRKMEKTIASNLFHWNEIWLLDTNDTCKSEDMDLDFPYEFMKRTKSKYVQNYYEYAYKNDQFSWASFIVENIDVEYTVFKGINILRPYDIGYKKYKDKNVYVIKKGSQI